MESIQISRGYLSLSSRHTQVPVTTDLELLLRLFRYGVLEMVALSGINAILFQI